MIIRFLTHYVWVLLLVSHLAEAANTTLLDNSLILKQGDVIVKQNADSTWNVVRILELDKWQDNTVTAHCMTYEPTAIKPSIDTINQLGVLVWHAPIAAESFNGGWQRIGNQQVSSDHLLGFEEYLKQTDFKRYVEYTGKSINDIVSAANKHFQRGYALGTEGKTEDAIKEYSSAVELFPLFYEAIDNRGFSYMDLGNYEAALIDFESSLRVNPTGMHAFFSKGECLLKLGRSDEAAQVFQQGMTLFPSKKDLFQRYYGFAKQ